MKRLSRLSEQWDGRRPARAVVAAVLVVVISLVVLGGPAPRPGDLAATSPAGAAPPGPPLVVEGDVVRTYSFDPDGVHVDPWVVWVCVIEPGGSIPERLPITADDVVEALDEEIAPYFEWLSRGAYQPTYTAGGSIDSGTNDPDVAIGTCMQDAAASPASAGFAGAVVILNAPYEDAVGDSGHQDCGSPPCTGSTTFPGNQRTIQLGAHDLFTTTTIGDPWLAEAAHEFGHTLDWGHAGPDPSYRVHEPEQDGYVPTAADAPWLDAIDPAVITALDAVIEAQGLPSIESDRAALGSASVDCNVIFTKPTTTAGWSLCTLLSVLAYGGLYDVMGTDPSPLTPDTYAIPQTQVFNRYASGWIDDEEIVTHSGGYQEYEVAPLDVDGTQMLVLPLSDPSTYVMVEARRPTPFLPGDENTGVLVNVVDQRPDSCGDDICWGDSDWKTMAYDGEPWNQAQLLDVGDRMTVDGTPIEVGSVDADGRFTIRIGEPPVGPGPGPAPAPVVHRPVVATPVYRQPSFTG